MARLLARCAPGAIKIVDLSALPMQLALAENQRVQAEGVPVPTLIYLDYDRAARR